VFRKLLGLCFSVVGERSIGLGYVLRRPIMFLRCPWLSSYDSSVLTYSTALYFVLFYRILLDEITTYITRQTTVPIYARLSSPTVDLCRRFDRCQHAEHNVQPDPNFYRLRYKLLSHCCLSAVSTAGPPFLQKLLQIWFKIILTISKIPSSISLTSLPI